MMIPHYWIALLIHSTYGLPEVAEPVDPVIRTLHRCQCMVECKLLNRDLIRRGHFGQRSWEPRKQREESEPKFFA
jgi:hypothetical protein